MIKYFSKEEYLKMTKEERRQYREELKDIIIDAYRKLKLIEDEDTNEQK